MVFIDYDPAGRFSTLPRIEEGLQRDGSHLKVTIPTAFTLFRFLDVMQVRDVCMHVCVCVCVCVFAA